MTRLENRNVNLVTLILTAYHIYRNATNETEYSDRLALHVTSLCRNVDCNNNARLPQARVSTDDIKFIVGFYYRLLLSHAAPIHFQPSNLKITGNLLIIEGWYDI